MHFSLSCLIPLYFLDNHQYKQISSLLLFTRVVQSKSLAEEEIKKTEARDKYILNMTTERYITKTFECEQRAMKQNTAS